MKTYRFATYSKKGAECTIELIIPESCIIEDVYYLTYGSCFIVNGEEIRRSSTDYLTALAVSEIKEKPYTSINLDKVKAYRYWPSGAKQTAWFEDKRYGFDRLKDVDSIENLGSLIFKGYDKRVAYTTQDKWLYSPDPMDRFIGRISPFIFDRVPENTNKNTFDFIRCDVSIMGVENHHEFCQKNYKKIVKKVLTKLEQTKRFQRYGVPVNILKLSKATVLKDGDLALLFEIKS